MERTLQRLIKQPSGMSKNKINRRRETHPEPQRDPSFLGDSQQEESLWSAAVRSRGGWENWPVNTEETMGLDFGRRGWCRWDENILLCFGWELYGFPFSPPLLYSHRLLPLPFDPLAEPSSATSTSVMFFFSLFLGKIAAYYSLLNY